MNTALPSFDGPHLFILSSFGQGWERWPQRSPGRGKLSLGTSYLIILPLSWSTLSEIRSGEANWNFGPIVQKNRPERKAHYNLAIITIITDRPKGSGEFELALKLDPKMAAAHFNLGVIDYKRGSYEEAAQRFKKPCAQSEVFTGYVYLGSLSSDRKDEEGLAEFEKTLKMDPGNVRALNQLGMTHLRNGDLERQSNCLGSCADGSKRG